MINALPDTPELRYIAARSVWFKPPVEALANPRHLIAYVLTYGTPECVSILRRYFTDTELIEVLTDTPQAFSIRVPGIIGILCLAYTHRHRFLSERLRHTSFRFRTASLVICMHQRRGSSQTGLSACLSSLIPQSFLVLYIESQEAAVQHMAFANLAAR